MQTSIAGGSTNGRRSENIGSRYRERLFWRNLSSSAIIAYVPLPVPRHPVQVSSEIVVPEISPPPTAYFTIILSISLHDCCTISGLTDKVSLDGGAPSRTPAFDTFDLRARWQARAQ